MLAFVIFLFRICIYVIMCFVLNFWIATLIFMGYLVISYLIFRFVLGIVAMDAWTSLALVKDPGNSLIITSYVLMDKLTLEELRELYSKMTALSGAKTMKQMYTLVLGNGYWLPPKDYPISKHVVLYERQKVHSREQLFKALGDEMMIPFPKDIPQWQVLFVPDFDVEANKSVFIFKVSHAIGDGISLTNFLFRLSSTPPIFYKEFPKFPCIWKVIPYLFYPFFVVYSFFAFMANEDNNCLTYHNEKPMSGVRVVASAGPYSVPVIRERCKKAGMTINDLMGAVVLRSFRKYIALYGKEGSLNDDSTINLDIPVTYRDRDSEMTLSVKIGLYTITYPLLKGENVEEDLKKVNKIMETTKKNRCLFFSAPILASVETLLPTDLLYWSASQWTKASSSVFTNVPGTRNQIKFFGKTVYDMHFLSPNVGPHPTCVGIFTYAEQLSMLAVSDKNRMEHPEKYAEFFEESINVYLRGEKITAIS